MGKFSSLPRPVQVLTGLFAPSTIGEAFSGLRAKVQTPQITPPAAPPTRDDQQVQQARERAVEAARLRRGRAATVLSSGAGVQDELGSVSRPQARAATMLGGLA